MYRPTRTMICMQLEKWAPLVLGSRDVIRPPVLFTRALFTRLPVLHLFTRSTFFLLGRVGPRWGNSPATRGLDIFHINTFSSTGTVKYSSWSVFTHWNVRAIKSCDTQKSISSIIISVSSFYYLAYAHIFTAILILNGLQLLK